jgi:hypothetical protein
MGSVHQRLGSLYPFGDAMAVPCQEMRSDQYCWQGRQLLAYGPG